MTDQKDMTSNDDIPECLWYDPETLVVYSGKEIWAGYEARLLCYTLNQQAALNKKSRIPPMTETTEVKLKMQPIRTPNFIRTNRDEVTFQVSELTRKEIERLCQEFTRNMIEKAGYVWSEDTSND